MDWRQASLSDYFEAMEAHADAHSENKEPREASDGLKAFMKAHTGGGKKRPPQNLASGATNGAPRGS